MLQVILVHGFNVWDGGRDTVGKLHGFFTALGVPCVLLNYGHFGLLDTRFKNDAVARRLRDTAHSAAIAGYQVVAIGHSNGAAIIHRATTAYAARIDRAVYINPALQRDLAPGLQVKRVDVWHSPSDTQVQWAKLLPVIDARPWGEMGATGYRGADARMVNLNKETNFAVKSREHSDVFDSERLAFFGPLMAQQAVRG